MADIQGLLKDPRFQALPKAEQEALLKQLAGAPTAPGLTTGMSPPSDITLNIGAEPQEPGYQPPTPAQTEQVRASIPPQFGGTVTEPPPPINALVENILKYGPPALAATLTGGASYPAQLGGQLVATGAQQALGVVRPGIEPYAETALADVVGRGTMLGGSALFRRGIQSSPAGREYIATQERDALRLRLDASMQASELQQADFDRQINQALGRGRQSKAEFDAEANRAIGEGVQSKFAFKQAADQAMERGEREAQVLKTEIDRTLGRSTQEAASLQAGVKSFQASTERSIRQARQQSREAQEGLGLVRSALDQTSDNIKKVKQFQIDQGHLARETVTVDARQWLKDYPTPNDQVIEHLYREVDKHNQTILPDEAFEPLAKLQKELSAKEARIRSIMPEMTNKEFQRLGRQAAQAETEAVEQATPRMVAPQELQDFIRQPTAGKKWGINLSNEELYSEFDVLLGKKESGTSKLKNRNGFTTSEMAQRAHEQGFIDSPDVNALKEALDESITMGRPVYSKYGSADVEYAGLTPQDLEAPRTFQGMRETITRVGQRLGDARRHGTNEQVAALSRAYGALQDGLKAAEESAALDPAVRDLLKTANGAYKIKATMEEFEALVEKNIRTPAGQLERFQPGAVKDAIRKTPELRKHLEEIGELASIEQFLDSLQAKLAAPADALRKARELELTARGIYRQLSTDQKAVIQHYIDTQQSMQERFASAKESVGEAITGPGGIKQQAEARTGYLKSQAEIALEDAKRKAGLLTEQGVGATEQAEARAGMLGAQGAAAVEQAQARAGMLTSEAQTAKRGSQEVEAYLRERRQGVQGPDMIDMLTWRLPAAIGTLGTMATGSIRTGTIMAAPFGAYTFLVRLMMTPKGQQIVGKILEASGGRLTTSAMIVLSQVAKDPMMEFSADVSEGAKLGLGIGSPGGGR